MQSGNYDLFTCEERGRKIDAIAHRTATVNINPARPEGDTHARVSHVNAIKMLTENERARKYLA